MKLAMLLVAVQILAGRAGPPEVGDPAPKFKKQDLEGKRFELGRYVGDKAEEARKALVLVFFEVDKPDCKKELHQLNKLDREWRPKGVEIVHIGRKDTKRQVRRFVADNQLTWRVVPDESGKIAKRYGVRNAPHLLIVAADGNIAFASLEYAPARYQTLRKELARITGTRLTQERRSFLSVDAKYEFGRPPSSSGVAVRWQPFAALIGRHSRTYIRMVGSNSYGEFEYDLRKGRFHLANAGALLAYELRDSYEPVAALERGQGSGYRGIFFASKDAGVSAVGDLSGKRLALVSPRSTSGGVYPFAELQKAGLQPAADVTLLWVGSHSNVAEAVRTGRADAGACYEDCRKLAWHDVKKMEGATQVIGHTDKIPADVILLRRNLPVDHKERLTKAILGAEAKTYLLTQISSKGMAITGIKPVAAGTLDPVGDVLASVADALAAAQKPAKARQEGEQEQ